MNIEKGWLSIKRISKEDGSGSKEYCIERGRLSKKREDGSARKEYRERMD